MPDQTHIPIRLTFVDADSTNREPAAVGTAARGSVAALRDAGYTVTPAYTGEKGGEVFEVVRDLAITLNDNRAFIQALVELATPIVAYLLGRQSAQTEKSETDKSPTIIVHVGNAAKEIPVQRVQDDEALLAQLLDLQDAVGDVDLTQESPIIEVRITPPPTRRRR